MNTQFESNNLIRAARSACHFCENNEEACSIIFTLTIMAVVIAICVWCAVRCN